MAGISMVDTSAQAMDSLKIMIANIADLMDRQFAQLVDYK